MSAKKEKICFIISTIGSDNSEPREKADEKLNYLFAPTLEKLGYKPIRADGEDIPGSITRKIVERIIESDMVIADITDENPNVFYELAIRNSVNKPIIIIKSPTQKPPFDIQDTRAISVDMSKPKIWQSAISQLENQIKEAEKDPKQASKSILSDFVPQMKLEKPIDRDSEMMLKLKDIDDKLKTIQPKTSGLKTNDLFDFTLPNPKYDVECKSCHYAIPISRKERTMQKFQKYCPHCGSIYSYSGKDSRDPLSSYF